MNHFDANKSRIKATNGNSGRLRTATGLCALPADLLCCYERRPQQLWDGRAVAGQAPWDRHVQKAHVGSKHKSHSCLVESDQQQIDRLDRFNLHALA